jgi:hypothetical protein
MTREGRGSSTPSNRSNSIPIACLEYTLKFAPSTESVAPSGELRPSVGFCVTVHESFGGLHKLRISHHTDTEDTEGEM